MFLSRQTLIMAACLSILLPLVIEVRAQGAKQPSTKQPLVVDADGQPLPPGAVARLGTLRFRHLGGISSLAFSSDGKTLASGGSSTIRLWEVPSGKLIQKLDNSPREVTTGPAFPSDESVGAVLFSAQDKLLALGNYGNKVLLYEPITGRLIREFADEQDEGLRTGQISPDGRLVATVSSRQFALDVWDASTGKRLHRLWEPGNFATK
jgi:WD40 repeat protein